MTFQLNARPASELAAERGEVLRKQLTAAIDNHVESVAKSREYNNAAALAGYANSTVPEWAAEAQTFVAWRDAVWLQTFTMLEQVMSGALTPPTEEELLASFPEIVWPD